IRLALQQLGEMIVCNAVPATITVPAHRDDVRSTSGSEAAKKAWATRNRKAVQ
ncbi:MAG: hypothetical protein H0T51_21820, partial [Pirellulales bacterium]|nr:hypothetical protein [Pirellulales bacterium]